MKECVVPRCGYVGENESFAPVFVPEEPYRPCDLVVKCPRCGRVGQLSALKEQVSEWEQRKREFAQEWVPLAPLRPSVIAALERWKR